MPADLRLFPSSPTFLAGKPLSKLPVSGFGGDCWWHMGAETLPAPRGCAAFTRLQNRRFQSPKQAPAQAGDTGVITVPIGFLLVCAAESGRIQPPSPTAGFLVVSWLALCKYFYLAEPQIIAYSFAIWVCDKPENASMCLPEIIRLLLCSAAFSSFTLLLLFLGFVHLTPSPRCMVPFLIPLKTIDFISWSFFLYLFLKCRKAASLHVSLGDCCLCSVCLDSIKNMMTFPHQTLSPSLQSIFYLDSVFQFISAKYYNSLSLWDSTLWLHCNDSTMFLPL